jgi:8-amino-7-oxononanoate synthase
LAGELRQRATDGLYRSRTTLDSPQGVEPVIDGRSHLSFCSNDYLGLANDPRVRGAFSRAARRYGVGSGASHLVTGHLRPHHALEEELADFTGRARALLFSTGYMANLGLTAALAGRRDTLFEDRLNHASLLDGGVLSRATLRRFPHADVGALERLLTDEPRGRKLVLTDGVFSMGGDIAPLREISRVAWEQGAWLVVDDAHGLGVVGPTGRGSLEVHGLSCDDVPILMGTLGKAFGTFGAFVAGSDALVETLIQQARSYSYTTALPPAVAEAARTSLRIVRDEPWRRDHLADLVRRFRHGVQALGLPVWDSMTPIQPIVLGDPRRVLHAAARLRERGIFVVPIRPPTVPRGAARLRIALSAAHTPAHVDRLLDVLAELGR